MIRKLIIVLIALALTTQVVHANQSKLQVRGYYGTTNVYSGNKNKVNVQLSSRAYYAIKNTGIENIEIKLSNSKHRKNLIIDTNAIAIQLTGKNLVFSLSDNLLKHRGVHHLTITTSNQTFDGSFNYIPTFEIINDTNGGLEVEMLPDILVESFDPEDSDGLVIEDVSEEQPVQAVSSGDGLEISFD